MNTKQKLLGAAITLAMGISGTANAFSVNTGFGNIGGIDGFDWAAGTGYAQQSLPLPLTSPSNGDKFQVYSQAHLSSYQAGSSTISDGNLNSKYELTYVTGFGEIGSLLYNVPGFGAGAGFVFDSTVTDVAHNFFAIYYDDLTDASGVKSHSLSGDGYMDGDLVLFGQIINDDGLATFTSGNFAINTAATGLLDTNGADDWSGKQTYTGSGSNTVVVDLISQNIDRLFFNNLALTTTTLTILSSDAATPFRNTDPSRKVAGVTVNDLPTINGDPTCTGATTPKCGFIFENDSRQKLATIPEPDMIALFGIGLFGMGAAARRKSA